MAEITQAVALVCVCHVRPARKPQNVRRFQTLSDADFRSLIKHTLQLWGLPGIRQSCCGDNREYKRGREWHMGGCVFIGGLAVTTGVLTLLSGVAWIGRLVISASTWIKQGEWPEYSVLQFLFDISVRPPQTDLHGIQKVINWVLAQSLTGSVFTATLLFYCLTLWLGIAAGSCAEEQRRLKKHEEERRNRPPELSLEGLVEGWGKQEDPLGLRSTRKPKG